MKTLFWFQLGVGAYTLAMGIGHVAAVLAKNAAGRLDAARLPSLMVIGALIIVPGALALASAFPLRAGSYALAVAASVALAGAMAAITFSFPPMAVVLPLISVVDVVVLSIAAFRSR